MNLTKASAISTSIAHALAWIVFIWMIFAPFYQGESVTAVYPGEIPSEPTRTTATIVEVNGWGVLPILFLPVFLTGLALLSFLRTHAGQTRRKLFAWVLAVLLLVFCILGSFSIGLFYFPSALALVLAAIVGSGTRRSATNTG